MGPVEMGDSTDAKDVLVAVVSSAVVTCLGFPSCESDFVTGADKWSALFCGTSWCGAAEVTPVCFC